MKVKDNPQFERDSNGAIINTDTDAYHKYIKAKKNRENKDKKIEQLEKQVEELQKLVLKMVDGGALDNKK